MVPPKKNLMVVGWFLVVTAAAETFTFVAYSFGLIWSTI